jgi:hypothetical protein
MELVNPQSNFLLTNKTLIDFFLWFITSFDFQYIILEKCILCGTILVMHNSAHQSTFLDLSQTLQL